MKDANLKKEKGEKGDLVTYFYTIAINSDPEFWSFRHISWFYFSQQSRRLLTFTTDLPSIYYDINILF